MIQIKAPSTAVKPVIALPGSKSISNRLLVLKHVYALPLHLQNLSDSEDTKLLEEALKTINGKSNGIIDIGHAGTDMRFLTAVLSGSEGTHVLTGSNRMKERPIGTLVEALRSLGANIQYLEKEHYPPLRITGTGLRGGHLSIEAGISSQFISALLLIAPSFSEGLILKLEGEMVSAPYVHMTIGLLQQFGVEVSLNANTILVAPGAPKAEIGEYSIESDWSAASYWYSICALQTNSEIKLSQLSPLSSQADAILPDLYRQLGVATRVTEKGPVLTHTGEATTDLFKYDFTNCPDIAQTVAVTCAGLGIGAILTGLQTLRIKETDRILALQTELRKLGVDTVADETSLQLMPRNSQPLRFHEPVSTYGDHRMAMSFAPLALCGSSLSIAQPEVVSKSYPGFWQDLKTAGFSVNLRA